MNFLLGTSRRALRVLPNALRATNRLSYVQRQSGPGALLGGYLSRTWYSTDNYEAMKEQRKKTIVEILKNSEFSGPHFDELVSQVEKGDRVDINTFNLTLRGIAKLNPSFSWQVYSITEEVFDISPDIQTYSIILPVLYVLGDMDRAVNVYTDMKEQGIEPNYSVHRVMLRVWTEIEHTNQALAVLDHLTSIDPKVLEKDKAMAEIMRSYDKLIQSEIRRGNNLQVIAVFYSILKKGLMPQISTTEAVFDYWAQQKDKFHLADAFSILSSRKKGCTIEIYNIYLKALVDMCEIDAGKQVWDQLVERGFHPDADSYNWLMNLSMLREDHKSILAYYEEMISRGVMPTVRVYFTMIKTWSKLGLIHNALEMMTEMQKKGMIAEKPKSKNETSLEEVYCYLIKVWAENGDVQSASELYDKLSEQGVEPSRDLNNAILEVWTKRGEFHFAEKLLNVMEQSDRASMKPEESSYCLFMSAWAERGEYIKAKSMFQRMKGRGVELSVASYNILLSALTKETSVDYIYEMNAIWKDMQVARISVNAETFINQMRFWAKLKRNDKVLYTFNEILLSGLQLNQLERVDLYYELVNYLVSTGELEGALEYANEMVERDPCLTSYIAKIKALAAKKEYNGILKAYQEMTEAGIYATSEFYATMIKIWSENNINKAITVFKEMEEASKVNPKLRPTPSVYKTMIEIWTDQGEFDKAIKVLKRATSDKSLDTKQIFLSPSANTKSEAEVIKDL